MKKLTLVLMVVVMGVLLTVPAFALDPGEGRSPVAGKGDCSCSKQALWKLNLSAEQKTKIEALISENQKAIRPLREKMFDKSIALRRLWSQANPDKDKIIATQKEVRKLRDEKQDRVTAMRLEIRKILTPEQNEKLANSHWGKAGYGPRGSMRGHDRLGLGMEMCP
jgi:Spy/CpxP family protein refolding chaperone